MRNEQVLYEVKDHIAVLTLNRPEKLNAWTLQMEEEFCAAVSEAARDEAVRVLVVTGAGRAFCAGADLSLLSSVVNKEIDVSQAARSQPLPELVSNARPDFQKQYSYLPAVPKPVLAAIHGPAVGLGLLHTLYCDIRFASSEAKFGTAFVQRGLVAEHGIAWLLPRLIGLQNAMDLLFSGRLISGEEAHHMGLVSHVLPEKELLPKVMEYAQLLATQCSPRSLAVMKREIWDAQFSTLGEAIDQAIEDMLDSFESEDFREGVQCAMERRAPRFTGR